MIRVTDRITTALNRVLGVPVVREALREVDAASQGQRRAWIADKADAAARHEHEVGTHAAALEEDLSRIAVLEGDLAILRSSAQLHRLSIRLAGVERDRRHQIADRALRESAPGVEWDEERKRFTPGATDAFLDELDATRDRMVRTLSVRHYVDNHRRPRVDGNGPAITVMRAAFLETRRAVETWPLQAVTLDELRQMEGAERERLSTLARRHGLALEWGLLPGVAR